MSPTTTVEVVKLPGGAPTSYAGVAWRAAFERGGAQAGEVRIPAGTTGSWRHHGARTLYDYVLSSGKSALGFGPKGSRVAPLNADDFFCVPAGLVHRDGTITRPRPSSWSSTSDLARARSTHPIRKGPTAPAGVIETSFGRGLSCGLPAALVIHRCGTKARTGPFRLGQNKGLNHTSR